MVELFRANPPNWLMGPSTISYCQDQVEKQPGPGPNVGDAHLRLPGMRKGPKQL